MDEQNQEVQAPTQSVGGLEQRPKKSKKIIATIAIITGISILLLLGYGFSLMMGGLSSYNKALEFKGSSEQHEFVLSSLNKKYAKDFEVVWSNYYFDEGGNKAIEYVLKEKGDSEARFEAYLALKNKEDATGVLTDAYQDILDTEKLNNDKNQKAIAEKYFGKGHSFFYYSYSSNLPVSENEKSFIFVVYDSGAGTIGNKQSDISSYFEKNYAEKWNAYLEESGLKLSRPRFIIAEESLKDLYEKQVAFGGLQMYGCSKMAYANDLNISQYDCRLKSGQLPADEPKTVVFVATQKK